MSDSPWWLTVLPALTGDFSLYGDTVLLLRSGEGMVVGNRRRIWMSSPHRFFRSTSLCLFARPAHRASYSNKLGTGLVKAQEGQQGLGESGIKRTQ